MELTIENYKRIKTETEIANACEQRMPLTLLILKKVNINILQRITWFSKVIFQIDKEFHSADITEDLSAKRVKILRLT